MKYKAYSGTIERPGGRELEVSVDENSVEITGMTEAEIDRLIRWLEGRELAVVAE